MMAWIDSYERERKEEKDTNYLTRTEVEAEEGFTPTSTWVTTRSFVVFLTTGALDGTFEGVT